MCFRYRIWMEKHCSHTERRASIAGGQLYSDYYRTGQFYRKYCEKLYVSSKGKLMKHAKITYTKTVKDATKEQLQQGII